MYPNHSRNINGRQGGISGKETGLFDPKLDVALNLNLTRIFKKSLTTDPRTKAELLILSLFDKEDLCKCVVGVEIIGVVVRQLLTSYPRVELSTILKSAQVAIALQEWQLMSKCTENIKQELTTYQELSEEKIKFIPDFVFTLYEGCLELDKVVEFYKRVAQNPQIVRTKDSPPLQCYATLLNMEFYFTKYYCVIQFQNQLFLLPEDQLLTINNKVLEIFNVYTLRYYLSGVNFVNDFHLRVRKLLDFMCDHVVKKGNKAYNFFKAFDGISTSLIMYHRDVIVNTDLLNFLRDSLLDTKNCTLGQWNRVLTIFGNGGPETLEFSGMSKLLGHPDIDTIQGIKKLRERTMRRNEVSREKVSELLCFMKENFCHRYLLKHKVWPPLILHPFGNRRI